eukprot:CAMPEP_0184392136 /NCGR_PEP_ID=MMETSP0007-20130409/24409_1 /TAXON_ID=97485 /ORGANISM="Prymnesium parvum, Strain Texoma1" /LENGTH=63 /DNA_ID=CAMNT_0026742583 /DNA_START=251 /DNA_END=442 /DNA_ORIENTATION=+
MTAEVTASSTIASALFTVACRATTFSSRIFFSATSSLICVLMRMLASTKPDMQGIAVTWASVP